MPWLDGLDAAPPGHDRHSCQLTRLEQMVCGVEALLVAGLTMADIMEQVHEAEDLYNGHCGELADTTLTDAQEQKFQSLPCRFDEIDTLNRRR